MSDFKTIFLRLLGAIRATHARASGEQIYDFDLFYSHYENYWHVIDAGTIFRTIVI